MRRRAPPSDGVGWRGRLAIFAVWSSAALFLWRRHGEHLWHQSMLPATRAGPDWNLKVVQEEEAFIQPESFSGYPGLYHKAFVINRKVDVERLQLFQETANLSGVQVEVFPALDKSSMNPAQLERDGEIGPFVRKFLEEDFKVVAGAFACTISHNRLWRRLTHHRPDNTSFLIFEDDSYIPADFHQRLFQAMLTVPEDWDLLYLNHNQLVGDTLPSGVWLKPATINPGRGKNALLNAYMARPAGLRRILRFQHPVDYSHTNDDRLRRHFSNFTAYFLISSLVGTRGRSVRTSLA